MVAPIIQMLNTKKHNGISGIATQLSVLHSGECPLRGGFAQSLTNWANTTAVEASWHWFVDPIAIVEMVPAVYAAWHASEANPMSEGFEQAGYARYTREEWLTADGLVMIDNLAWIMAKRNLANGIPPVWLTTDQVTAITTYGDRVTKGMCLHRQIDPETRTDPGDNYPFDVLTAKIKFYMIYMGQGDAPIIEKETEDKMLYIVTEPNGKLWIGDGISRRHIPNMDMYEDYRNVASVVSIYKDGEPQVWPPEVIGVDIEGVVRANAVTVALGSSDVAALAAALKDTLAPDVAEELARRLAE